MTFQILKETKVDLVVQENKNIMIIRKLFKFEGSHIVRDCSSDRCKYSIHGHSYRIEIFLSAQGLDNGQMIVDFGLLKNTIKDFIDSFDHCHVMWSQEHDSDKLYFKNNYQRWIELPCSPSAEMLSLMFFFVIDKIIKNTKFNNGEQNPILKAVRVHETDTGWAECDREDVIKMWHWSLEDIVTSPSIMLEWKDSKMYEKLIKNINFINPKIYLRYVENNNSK